MFTVDPVLNSRNSRYISGDWAADVRPSVKSNPKTKHQAKIMMLGLVASDGKKCPPIPMSAKKKLDAEKYLEMFKRLALPWIQSMYPTGNYVFHQDGTHPHAAHKTQNFFISKVPSVWLKNMSPPGT